MYKVSVVIPTYNNATFIEECFKSVVSQSYYKYIKEIFIIDDRSTDNTPRILSRLNVFHKQMIKINILIIKYFRK